MRINGHDPLVETAEKLKREPLLCVETQARAITAAIVAEAIEEALGQRHTCKEGAAAPMRAIGGQDGNRA